MPQSQVLHVEEAIRRINLKVPELSPLDSLICRVITILGRDLTVRLDQALETAGLAELEFRTLLTIYSRDGTATPGDLSASLAQSPANLTRISDVLVGRGLVSRSPSDLDRRRTLLAVTAQGERLLGTLLPTMAVHTTQLFDGFSTGDKQRLLGDLKQLLGALDGLDVAPQTAAAS